MYLIPSIAIFYFNFVKKTYTIHLYLHHIRSKIDVNSDRDKFLKLLLLIYCPQKSVFDH